jgi:hypothetical protein
MSGDKNEGKVRGKALIVVGFVVIVIIMVLYSRYQDSEYITPGALDNFLRMAFGFYVIMIVAFGAISYGLYQFHKDKAAYYNDVKENGLLSIIAKITWNDKSRKIFVVTFVTYGIFFSLVSGTLVYQPEVIFSYHYGAVIPSAQLIPCCDAPGYMPKILVYLTEHVGLQIIPLNLVLQVMVSYLVGLNMAIAVNAVQLSKKGKSLGTVGSITGLFIACPTCVGSFSSVFIGTASGIALSVALVQLQTLFIAITIPVLLLTPFILARKIASQSKNCAVDENKENNKES